MEDILHCRWLNLKEFAFSIIDLDTSDDIYITYNIMDLTLNYLKVCGALTITTMCLIPESCPLPHLFLEICPPPFTFLRPALYSISSLRTIHNFISFLRHVSNSVISETCPQPHLMSKTCPQPHLTPESYVQPHLITEAYLQANPIPVQGSLCFIVKIILFTSSLLIV